MYKINSFTPSDYFGSNTFIIDCGSECAVVDPAVDYETVALRLPEIRGKIKHILLTHGHFDHILKINDWLKDGATVYVGEGDADMLHDPYLNCYRGFLGIEDGYYGDAVKVNTGSAVIVGGERISVIDCPGHTPGSVGYILADNIFIGDTVFDGGGYGRCDLPGGDFERLKETLSLLFSCQQNYTLYPGHGNKVKLYDARKYFI